MPVDITTQYLTIIATTFLFTALAILETQVNHKKVLLQWVSAVGWIVCGFVHLLGGDITSMFTVAPTYFFIGLGIIFALNGLYVTFQLWSLRGEKVGV